MFAGYFIWTYYTETAVYKRSAKWIIFATFRKLHEKPVSTKVAGHSAIISKVCSFVYVFKGIFIKFKISFSVEFEWKAGFSNFLLNISHKICFLCFKLVSPEQMFGNNDYLQMIYLSLWDWAENKLLVLSKFK